MSRFITVKKTNGLVTGGKVTYVEMWLVPEDFSEQEITLLTEICDNNVLDPQQAFDCVRKLRK
jgi:hypothetical protein